MNAYNYDEAHEFVARTKNARWDGWDIVIWKPNSMANMMPNGSLRNGRWGTESRISFNDNDGLWRV